MIPINRKLFVIILFLCPSWFSSSQACDDAPGFDIEKMLSELHEEEERPHTRCQTKQRSVEPAHPLWEKLAKEGTHSKESWEKWCEGRRAYQAFLATPNSYYPEDKSPAQLGAQELSRKLHEQSQTLPRSLTLRIHFTEMTMQAMGRQAICPLEVVARLFLESNLDRSCLKAILKPITFAPDGSNVLIKCSPEHALLITSFISAVNIPTSIWAHPIFIDLAS